MSKNISPLVADMRAYLEGNEKAEGGIASMSIHLADSLKAILSCDYTDGRSGRDVFEVKDFILDKPRNEDDSVSHLQQSARNVAMLTQLFGFEAYAIPDGAKQARDKALSAAIALSHYYRDADGKLSVYVRSVPGSTGGKRNVIGGIPAADMFDLVDAKGALTAAGKATFANFTPVFHREKKRFPKDDAELLAYMLSYPVESTGSIDPTFRGPKAALKAKSTSRFLKDLVERAIADGVHPKPVPKKPKLPVDGGVDLERSVKLLTDWVEIISAPDGETDVAPNAEREALLDKFCEAWAHYRAANPRLV
jgi:hypothetical protein